MSSSRYRRTVDELREVASMFWPDEVSKREAEMSIIPKLLETQDQFIAILGVPVAHIDGLFAVLSGSEFPGNLFLKHLAVLADFGGEMLQRLNSEFANLFPSGTLNYLWNQREYRYQFTTLPVTSLTNDRLGISGKKLMQPTKLNDLHKDTIALLVLGSASTDERIATILAKCQLGEYLGKPEELERFIKQRYIWVSRITGGSQSNNLGQIAQDVVFAHLRSKLGPEFEIGKNGHLPGVSHTNTQTNLSTTFDIVVAKNGRYVAVEVSFQVTTNSVIERKAGQARSRYEQIESNGYKIAYVIDGRGNFQRETALNTICSYSHCTVAFSTHELDILCDFLLDYLK